jgi:hypothetical protein
MPITYTVDPALGIINVVWDGEVTVDDYARHVSTLLTDPAALRVQRSLSDLRKATLLFTGQELQEKVKSVVIPLLQGIQWKTAILVGSPAQYGQARQFDVFAEAVLTDAIFHDYDAALSWLRQD